MNFTEKLNEELQHWEKMGEEEKKCVDQRIEEEITNLIEPTSQQLAELNQKKIRQYNRIDESILFLKNKTIEVSRKIETPIPTHKNFYPHDFIPYV